MGCKFVTRRYEVLERVEWRGTRVNKYKFRFSLTRKLKCGKTRRENNFSPYYNMLRVVFSSYFSSPFSLSIWKYFTLNIFAFYADELFARNVTYETFNTSDKQMCRVQLRPTGHSNPVSDFHTRLTRMSWKSCDAIGKLSFWGINWMRFSESFRTHIKKIFHCFWFIHFLIKFVQRKNKHPFQKKWKVFVCILNNFRDCWNKSIVVLL